MPFLSPTNSVRALKRESITSDELACPKLTLHLSTLSRPLKVPGYVRGGGEVAKPSDASTPHTCVRIAEANLWQARCPSCHPTHPTDSVKALKEDRQHYCIMNILFIVLWQDIKSLETKSCKELTHIRAELLILGQWQVSLALTA